MKGNMMEFVKAKLTGNMMYIIIVSMIMILIAIFISLIYFILRQRKRKKPNKFGNELDPLRHSSEKLTSISINEDKEYQALDDHGSKQWRNKRKIKANMWFSQLKVVLWKNAIIRKRHYVLTILEALIPVLLFLLIAYGRSKITGLNKREVTEVSYSEKEVLSYDSSGINLEETHFYYSPANEFFADLIYRVQVKFQVTSNNIQGFDTKENLLQEYAKTSNHSIIAVIFNTARGLTHLDYMIRSHEQYFSWNTGKLYENQYSFQPKQGSTYGYKGFLTLQKALDMSFIEKMNENGTKSKIEIRTLEFPYPPYREDSGLGSIFIHYLPLITLFSFIFVCPAVLKRVVEEKYSGIKELMKMVGMKSWMLWLGWFIYSIIPMFLSVLILVTIIKVDLFGVSYPLIEYANAGVLFVFLILYCTAATVACFFISTLFKKPTLATLVGLLVWILSYFVPKYLLEGDNNVSLALNYPLLVLPNFALHYGYTAISYYEEREIGINFSNWHLPGGGGSNEITMLNVCLMLILDTFIYMMLTLYFDRILPGKYGVPESIFFPVKRLKRLFMRRRNNVGGSNPAENLHLEDVEVGRGLHKGIELINLSKKYGKNEVVKNLSMDIYHERITVLLGHNGAGKTTTMGMITGMVQKNSGHIIMNGKSIESSYDVTETIGLCPQHNLFFPDLTVAEHLKFFAMLKGKSYEESEREINRLLEKLNLEEKANEMAHTLSGGMKRKLCLGMAVVGGSKVLILDEPSSGMDPESRRNMWDLLLSWRNDRTILITTHFMEEADALGDWIAIMNEGQLRCYGTPMYLKKSFETGYNLNILIKENVDIDEAIKDLKEEMHLYVNNSKLKHVNGREIVFLLPFENNYITMFEHLESNKDEFRIENMSFTTTTLEDVFLNTKGSPHEADDNLSLSSLNTYGDKQDYALTLKALIFKRYRFIYIKLKTYLIPCFVSLLFLLLCIYLGRNANDYSRSGGPALNMTLGSYGKTTVMFSGSDDPQLRKIKDFYGNLVTNEKSEFKTVDDVSEGIIEEGINNLPYYRHHMIAAAEFTKYGDELEAVAMYNNIAMHSAPISLNLITNTLAKTLLGEQYSISMSNHPLDNMGLSDDLVAQLSEVQIGLLWLIIMPLGFLFFLGSFIYFPFVELSTNFTQLQFMCGVPPSVYWLITYLSDLVVYIVFAFAMSIISLAWDPFRGVAECATIFLILVLYGLCGIPYAYLFGRKKSYSAAYALFIILGVMLGVLLTVIVFVLEESGDSYYLNMGNHLKTLFLIICPQFVLTYSGVEFARKVITNFNFDHMPALKRLSTCSRETANPCCSGDVPSCHAHKRYLTLLEPNIGWICLGAGIFLVINILIHNYRLRKLCNTARHLLYQLCTKKQNRHLDQNLLLGKGASDENNTNTLKVNRLKKSYSGKEVVIDVDFNLKQGECMGILGVNGAGKSTTFRMLTREEVKDNGDIKIFRDRSNDKDSSTEVNIDEVEYLRRLGYCPQNDALNYSLTGRDILKTMAWLRGINDNRVVDAFLDAFQLKEYADIPCEYYSGGNKRKLSFAVAVIGIPDVILLDEPTNGVDPSSRRKFWSLIKNIKRTCKTSFILTSHSMAECEALCNDLKIMNGGKIRKGGTIAKLREELNGFDVKMKLKLSQSADKMGSDEVDGSSNSVETNGSFGGMVKTPTDYLKDVVVREYPEAELKDEHAGLLHYYIKTEGAEKRWSVLFKQFETIRNDFPELIEDYSISEASLEDVFLDVARENTENIGEKKKSKQSQQ